MITTLLWSILLQILKGIQGRVRDLGSGPVTPSSSRSSSSRSSSYSSSTTVAASVAAAVAVAAAAVVVYSSVMVAGARRPLRLATAAAPSAGPRARAREGSAQRNSQVSACAGLCAGSVLLTLSPSGRARHGRSPSHESPRQPPRRHPSLHSPGAAARCRPSRIGRALYASPRPSQAQLRAVRFSSPVAPRHREALEPGLRPPEIPAQVTSRASGPRGPTRPGHAPPTWAGFRRLCRCHSPPGPKAAAPARLTQSRDRWAPEPLRCSATADSDQIGRASCRERVSSPV